ncbi:hypothetical protein SLEP1_g47351 [Rubroshorea leprosula]|uniref:Uncharacterized protein n=1 Tax=Rubroshorea leprosula TaxID=152421 RepID=A0AAV5LR09_9ROSI|nr:hypothetical protein SLEP1_g47351 [Rubroshorea leprosula]
MLSENEIGVSCHLAGFNGKESPLYCHQCLWYWCSVSVSTLLSRRSPFQVRSSGPYMSS